MVGDGSIEEKSSVAVCGGDVVLMEREQEGGRVCTEEGVTTTQEQEGAPIGKRWMGLF